MDKKQQAEQIQKIVDVIAKRALEQGPNARLTFIQGEIATVRAAFQQTYEADPQLSAYAMNFVNRMERWMKTRVAALETGGGHTGQA